jgi:hypothetical protein
MTGMLGFLFISGLFGLLFSAVTFVIWLWALIDCIKNPTLSSNERIVWVLVIIFVPCIGSVLYLIVGRK